MKNMRAWIAGLCAVPTVAAVLFSWALLGASPASATNIVLFLMDDAAALDAAAMPTLQQLVREGTSFDHAYSPSPMCAPGRAILQSGQYSQNNGVTQNGYLQFVQSGAINRTFAVGLHNAGIATGFVGKYMNGATASVPGWDSFIVQQETGASSAKGYYDYTLNIDGKSVSYGHAPDDYSVDVERDFGLRDIKAAHGRFMTMLAVHSPHNPLTPPARYLNTSGTTRQRTLLAVDDALNAIVGQLRQQGVYDSTYVVVTSDQGLAFGRKAPKGVPYEGSVKVPLVIEGPGVKAGVTLHQIANLADLAPTFLDWMGAPAMAADGRSLAPLLHGSGAPVRWRQAMGITHQRMGSAPGVPSWRGVRTTRYAYWKFQGGGAEVYDMGVDPEQKRNIAAAAPALTRKLAVLSDRLARCRGAECRRLEDRGPG